MNRREFTVEVDGRSYSVTLAEGSTARVNDRPYAFVVRSMDRNSCTLSVDGRIFQTLLVNSREKGVGLADAEMNVNGTILKVSVDDRQSALVRSLQQSVPQAKGMHVVRAPMPGMVSRLDVEAGDLLKSGDGILILEAMKMENEIRCPIEAVVSEIKVKAGQSVERNEILAVLKADARTDPQHESNLNNPHQDNTLKP